MAAEIPLPPYGTWMWYAATTLAAVVAQSLGAGVELVERGGVWYARIPRAPREVAHALRDLSSRVFRDEDRGRALTRLMVFAGHDARAQLPQVLKTLCFGGAPRGATLGTLVDLVAGAIEGGCPTASQPVKALSLFRLEYYEFSRVFLERQLPSLKAVEVVRIPALTQGFGLVAHIYTRTAIYRRAQQLFSAHLILTDPAQPLLAGLYTEVRTDISLASGAWGGPPPTPVEALISASILAPQLGEGIPEDFVGEAVILVGRTFTLMGIGPLSSAGLAQLLREAAEELGGGALKRLRFVVRSLAFLAGLPQGRRSPTEYLGGVRDPARLASQLSTAVTVYAENMLLYTFTGSRDAAYAAVRAVDALLRSGDAAAATYLDPATRRGRYSLAEALRLLRDLGSAAARLSPPVERPVTPM